MSASDVDTFSAEQIGPPQRRYWIARDPSKSSNVEVRGWAFIYEEMGPDGEWRPGWDAWEEWFFEILRYPSEYAAGPLVWRREADDRVVDLATLQPRYDGKPVSSDETPESAGLRRPR